MTAELSRWGRGLFPEIKLSIRGSRELALSAPMQAGALAAAVALLCALACFGGWRLASHRAATDREAAMRRIESANVDLQEALAAVRDQLALATRNLGQAQDRRSSLTSQSDLLRGQLQSTEARLNALDELHQQLSVQKGEAQQILNQSLTQAQQQIHQLQAQRATLAARLNLVEADRSKQQDQVTQYKNDLDRMRAKLDELQKKLSARESWQRVVAATPAVPATASPGLAAAARQGVDRVAGLGREGLGQVERVLAAAGVDVNRLFGDFHVQRGLGGPFVAPAKFTPTDRLDGVAGLVHSLPVSAPLVDYRLESPFGERHDPFNRREGFHTGVDLSAPYMTPVYATAPGIVTYAGWKGDYGKVVEIDHGHGISTLYAHLHRTIVAEGEHIAAHVQIGFVGTTGRATGPHCHYEVRVNGEPQDPEKFLNLAHLIPTAAR